MNTRSKKFYLTVILITVFSFLTGTASAHVEEGHMPDAVAEVEYKILLEFKPKDIVTRTKLAFVLIRQGKPAKAEEQLDKALEQSPDDYRVLEGFIILRLKQQRVHEALELAKKAINENPDKTIFYRHYGKVLEANGQHNMAQSIYQTGLQKLTGNNDQHDRQQLEEAIAELKTMANKQ